MNGESLVLVSLTVAVGRLSHDVIFDFGLALGVGSRLGPKRAAMGCASLDRDVPHHSGDRDEPQ